MDEWKRAGLGGAGAMFVAMGLGRFSYGAMVPALVSAGHLSADQAGWVGGINLGGYVVGAFLSEALRRRHSAIHVLLVCVLISMTSIAASAVPWGFAWLAFWRGVVGVTAGLIMVLGLSLATEAAPADKRPQAAGLLFSGVGIGIFFSGVLVPWLLAWGIAEAWSGIAGVGVAGAVLAWAGWKGLHAPVDTSPVRHGVTGLLGAGPHRYGLAAAYFLFSFGITPHTLYWVDFLVRGLDMGLAAAGMHWAAVGIFAVLGPWAAAWLAKRTETSHAVVAAFVVLGAGIAAPAVAVLAPVLWLSTIVFGAQPGVTTVTAARARDLTDGASIASLMRVLILSSAIGAAVGGIAFPAMFTAAGRYDLLFAVGGGAMFLAAIFTYPRRVRSPAA